MEQHTISLADQLLASANAWSESHESTPARLGKLVVNDTRFFTRLGNPGASTTTATLEKFAAFLVDPVNWPEGLVPQDVASFCHRVGVSVPAASLATGQTDEMSGEEAA